MDKDTTSENSESFEDDVTKEKALEDVSLISLENAMRNFAGRYDTDALDDLCEDYRERFADKHHHYPKLRTQIKKVEELRQRSFDKISQKFRAELRRTGLGLELISIEDETYDNFRPWERQIRFKVQNAKYFIGYLDAILQRKKLKELQSLSLSDAITDFSLQLYFEYDLKNPDQDHTFELLAQIDAIVDRLEKLVEKGITEFFDTDREREDFTDCIANLKVFAAVSKMKYLHEFLLCLRSQLILSEEVSLAEDGAIQWNLTTERNYTLPKYYTPQELRDTLQSDLDILSTVARNPHAAVLHENAKKILSGKVEYYIGQVSGGEGSDLLEKKYILEDVQEKLSNEGGAN